MRAAYGYEATGCAQPLLDRQVARAYAAPGESVAACVTQLEGLCVGSCAAATAKFARGALVARSPRTGTSPAAKAGGATADGGGSSGGESGGELPTIFVLGCEACGSSSVASLLDLQPGVSLGWPLEGEPSWRADNPSFFSQEDLYARGLGWYRGARSPQPAYTTASTMFCSLLAKPSERAPVPTLASQRTLCGAARATTPKLGSTVPRATSPRPSPRRGCA